MEFSRSRDETQQLIAQGVLISTRRSFVRKFLELLLTTVFWIYTLVVTWFFMSAFVGQSDRYIATLKIALNVNNTDIRSFTSFGLVSMVVFAILLFGWRTYNKRRYGSLRRRKAPTDSTLEELEALKLIEPSVIHRLQHNQIIIFEKNPVKELRHK